MDTAEMASCVMQHLSPLLTQQLMRGRGLLVGRRTTNRRRGGKKKRLLVNDRERQIHNGDGKEISKESR